LCEALAFAIGWAAAWGFSSDTLKSDPLSSIDGEGVEVLAAGFGSVKVSTPTPPTGFLLTGSVTLFWSASLCPVCSFAVMSPCTVIGRALGRGTGTGVSS